MRVLYVDDEESLLELGKLFLEQEGDFSVDTVLSASAAIEILAKESYDAIISDYQMPEMDGIAFLKEVRSRYDTIPFILFTGRGREEIVIQALNDGADFYLQKGGHPVAQFVELSHKIVQAVSRKKAEKELRASRESLEQNNLILIRLHELEQEFAGLPCGKRVEDLAAKKLGALTGAVVSTFNTYDPVRQEIRCTDFELEPGILERLPGGWEKATALLGGEPTGVVVPLSRDMYKDINRSIVGKKNSISEISYGKISPLVSTALQMLSGIDRFFHIAHIIDGELFGTSVFGLRPDQPDPPEELLESFAHIVAVSLRRQRAEAALRENEEFSRSLVENLPDYIVIYGKDGKILYVNPPVTAMLGYTAEELMGRPVLAYVAEEYRKTVQENLASRRDGNDLPAYEIAIVRKDGARRSVIVQGKPLQYHNTPATLLVLTDITEQSRAREALRESEGKFRALVDQTLDGIVIIDLTGSLLFANAGAAKITGYSLDIVGKVNVLDIVSPEFRLRALADFARVAAGTDGYLVQYKILTREQKELWVECIGKKISFAGSSAMLLSIRDITRRLQDEEGLRESEERLRSFIEQAHEGVSIVDEEGRIIEWNTAQEKITGIPRHEAMGVFAWDLATRMIPDQHRREAICSRMEKSIRETIRTGVSTHPDPVYYQFHRPDGTVAIARQTVFIVKSLRGNMIGTLYQDVTEQQRAEGKVKESDTSYRGLFNTIRQALYILDREGKFVDVNAGAEKMYGYPREEFTGRTPEFLAAPGRNDLPAVAEKIQKAFTGEFQQFEFWGLRRNGEVFPKDVFLYRGTYFGKDIVLAVGIDITERRLAENALRESENKFSTVFRSNPVTLTLVSATDGRFVDVNDAFVANTGYSREEVIGRTAEEVGIFSDAGEYEQLQSRLQSGQPVKGMELHIRQKNGEDRACQFTSGIILMQGRPYILSSVEDIADRKNAELAFQAMTRGMVGTTGIISLKKITENVSSWLGADCVLIGEIQPDRQTVKVLSMLLDGKEVADYSYVLKGTPCDNTAKKGFCLYPDNVSQIFPEDRELAELHIRGYAGTPLRDSGGKAIGILCALFRQPVKPITGMQEILDIFAVKAAAEIERKQNEDHLTRINEALLNLGTDHRNNIERLTRLCGEMLGADCVLYNRLDAGLLCVIGQWNCPPDLPARDTPEGHICFDVIKKDCDDPLVVMDLQNSPYATSDPNVAAYGLKTYIGHPVRYGGVTRGSLCAVYTRDFVPTVGDQEIIGILSSAVAQEEERGESDRALRESEERFRSVIENIHAAVVVHNPDTSIRMINTTALDLLGLSRDEAIGRVAPDPSWHFSREDGSVLPHDEYPVNTVITTQKPIRNLLIGIFRPKCRDTIWGLLNADPEYDENGSLSAILVTFTDITGRKQADEALRQANRKLNLLSGITRHDINNQLLILNGYLEISKNYIGNAEKMSDFIERERTITKTIERQIAFTKEYEAIGVNAPVWQDCRMLVDTAAQQVQPGTIVVKNEIPPGLEVFADPLVMKVCYNLMDNAVRHGGRITTIRFFMEQRDGDHSIVYEDDGVGIPAEEKEQIFGRGFGKNTGMGLFLSAEILSITGITIRETGEPGKGARFELTVPEGAWRNTGK